MLRPIGNRILVKAPEEQENVTTASGFILEKPEPTMMATAEVVATSDNMEEKFWNIEVGSKVYFNKSSAFEEYKEDGQKYYIIEAKEILGIVEDKNA